VYTCHQSHLPALLFYHLLLLGPFRSPMPGSLAHFKAAVA